MEFGAFQTCRERVPCAAGEQHQLRAIGSDARIGPKFLTASIGVGGSCFQKHILNVVYICEQFGIHEVALYWQQVVDMNECQKKTSTLFNTVTNKKISVFRFAFKKDTGDVRETPSLTECRMLMEHGAIVHVYDPKVTREAALEEFSLHGFEVNDRQLVWSPSAEESVKDAHAIAVLTEWDEFKSYDYKKFYGVMVKPAFIFDGRNLLDPSALEKIGFEFHAVGSVSAAKVLGGKKVQGIPWKPFRKWVRYRSHEQVGKKCFCHSSFDEVCHVDEILKVMDDEQSQDPG